MAKKKRAPVDLDESKVELASLRRELEKKFRRAAELERYIELVETVFVKWGSDSFFEAAEDYHAKYETRGSGTSALLANVLRVAGRPLHVDEIVERLRALGREPNKKSIVAYLHRRAAEGKGFARVEGMPNTFMWTGLKTRRRPPVSGQARGDSGKRRTKN